MENPDKESKLKDLIFFSRRVYNSFYKTNPVEIFGFDTPDKPIHKCFLRFKHQLKKSNYKRIKKDLLRMHRQYVLSSEKIYKFDFIPFVTGPFTGAERLRRLIDDKPALD